METPIPLQFAQAVTTTANDAWASGRFLQDVTPTTASLLRFWFDGSHDAERDVHFHEGQRQAILNVIYLHELEKATSVLDAYQQVAPDLLLAKEGALAELDREKYRHPKYAVKMATGTGKTFVLSALLVWQYLNAKHEDPSRYSRNFLIVAPGLIVYERLLDAFLGKQRDAEQGRSFETSDICSRQDLFIPPEYRDEVFGFLQSSVAAKDEIGRKVTGDGIIAITNWHLLAGLEDESSSPEDIEVPGDLSPDEVLARVLPVRPGVAVGNSLAVLDNSLRGGEALEYLTSLPDLVAFNDEAHHIHDLKKAGEVSEVEWQKSLLQIARPKGARFVQVDFSATPYNERSAGRGKGSSKVYFPHIVVDFDLKAAIRKGLVKMIVLDKRKEIASLPLDEGPSDSSEAATVTGSSETDSAAPLDFKAERDDSRRVVDLSDGQKVMLRAGLEKLRILERHFTEDAEHPEAVARHKHPKMLVVCEETKVSPYVVAFLRQEGLGEEDVLQIDSNRQGEVPREEWATIKKALFDVDRRSHPKVIVSVLMLREGFDVNNICVIVPLRASKAQILLEQTIGRGLRLMWREPEYQDLRNENIRSVLDQHTTPKSWIDILSIIEHPAYAKFYKELIEEGLAVESETDLEDNRASVLGDLITIGLREGYERYDIAFPLIVHEAEEVLRPGALSSAALKPFTGLTLPQLRRAVPKGDVFVSEEVTKGTRFGDYTVSSGVMKATNYNQYLSRLVNRVAVVMDDPIKTHRKEADAHFPALQVALPELARAADTFIRTRLFGESIDPLAEDTWRVLLISDVADHVIKELAHAVAALHANAETTEADVILRKISEVATLRHREHATLPTAKTVYERTPYPTVKGGLEKDFIDWADHDGTVDAFVKLVQHAHDFVRFRYMREEGSLASYYPDFIVRCANDVTYLVETKADDQMSNANVQRKRRAAIGWVESVNRLPSELRGGTAWAYALLAEGVFRDWSERNASVQDMLEYVKLRETAVEGRLL